MSLKYIIFLIPLLISSHANIYNKTVYAWLQSTKNQYKGECYEIDRETSGKKYSVKVRKGLCRTENLVYKWQQGQRNARGRCYSTDKETLGERYSENADSKKCYPKDFSYYFQKKSKNKGHCLMIDNKTSGVEFSHIVKDSLCSTEKMTYSFVIDKSQTRGKCYQVDSETQGDKFIKKVRTNKCRPQKTYFIWKQKDILKNGVCFEVDSELGPTNYIKKTKKEKCYQNQSKGQYSWIKDHPSLKEGCYESGLTLDQLPYQNKVNSSKCKPKDITKTFIKISKLKGVCFELDQATFGKKYKKKITISDCRPEKGKYNSLTINNNCYYVDSRTNGDEYIEKTKKRNCFGASPEVYYQWKAKPENIWKGNCFKVVNGNSIYSFTKNCTPKETTLTWHNQAPFDGNCYKVHKPRGPEAYAEIVKKQLCRPDDISYKFHTKKNKSSGRCYMVDKKTQGIFFHKVVSNDFCRNRL